MAKENDSNWPPPPSDDPEAFHRVTEGQSAILGSGDKRQQKDQQVPSAPRKRK